MKAKIASRTNHWYIKADKVLKGKGVFDMRELGFSWDYKLTERAFEKLQQTESIQIENHEF